MSKQGGLGDNFYVGGYDLSGDINAIGSVGGGPALLNFTTINQSAHVRQGGLRDGKMDFTTFFDPSGSGPYTAGPAPLETLPTADVIATYCRGTTLGNAAACVNAKQINFDPTRGNDGALTLAVNMAANGYGLEWGKQLTAGLQTDASATLSAEFDDGAASSFGGQAYLQVTSLGSGTVTVAIQHATSSGGSYSDVLAFSAVSSAPTAQRISVSNTTTIDRFLKINTTGTFTNAVFSVVFVRNATAGIVF